MAEYARRLAAGETLTPEETEACAEAHRRLLAGEPSEEGSEVDDQALFDRVFRRRA